MSDMQAKSLTTGADTLAYLKSGAGPALVIIHGVGGHKEDWTDVMAALSGRFTVFAIDMLGFGGSSRDAKDLSMPRQADAVLALLDAEGVARADVIGNSVGGWVAATFAARNPSRLNRLVLVDAAGFKAMFDAPPAVNLFPASVEEMAQLLSTVLVSDFAHEPHFVQAAFERFQASGEAAIVPVLWPGLIQSPRLEDLMPSIHAPTLVLWGAEDRLFPPAIADLVSGGIAGSRKSLIPQAGHFPQIDNAKAFMAEIDGFLIE